MKRTSRIRPRLGLGDCGLALVVAGAALLGTVAPAVAADKKPNILFIVAAGWDERLAYGQRRRSVAPQGDRVQRRAVPRRHTPGGLEVGLAHPPARVRRAEKTNVAAQNPQRVAALQQRANELAVVMAKPMILQTEIKAMMERIKMPPSLPADLESLDEEP